MSETIQKDLVLSINEYAYVLDETKGHVSCLVGPTKMSLSQSDRLVRFNPRTKSFEQCGFDNAKYLFTTAPEEERSGLGFSVMESFTDKLTVKSTLGKGTVVTMRKKLTAHE